MNRRNFLGLLTAGVAIELLPFKAVEAAPLANQQVWTAASLTAEMEKLFACRVGPATAFFEVVKGTDEIVEKPLDIPYPPVYDRYIYETYGFAVEGGDAWLAEHQLAKHFYDEFSKVENKRLVWRRKPKFETEEIVQYGETWAKREDIEDGFVDLSTKPENVEEDFLTGNYRYVTRRYPLHRMTMRLVFTDQDPEVQMTMARHEGLPLPRI